MYVLKTFSIKLMNRHNDWWAIPPDSYSGMAILGTYWRSGKGNFLVNCKENGAGPFLPKVYKTHASAKAAVTRILNKHVLSLDDLADFTIDIIPLDQLL